MPSWNTALRRWNGWLPSLPPNLPFRGWPLPGFAAAARRIHPFFATLRPPHGNSRDFLALRCAAVLSPLAASWAVRPCKASWQLCATVGGALGPFLKAGSPRRRKISDYTEAWGFWAVPPQSFCFGKNAKDVSPVEVDLIFRIAAIGIIVSVLYQVLLRSGREEQAMLTSLAGLIVVLMMIIYEISNLFETAKAVFGL